MSKDLQI